MNLTNFGRILDAIKKSPLQKKKMEKYLSTRDEVFFDEAEEFSGKYISYLESENIPIEYAVEAYQKLCNDMMKCQVYFMKTGKYPTSSSEEANQNIYSNEAVMKLYMIGLAISQFFWATHYEMYSCLIGSIRKNSSNIKSYLEIGPGHGLFLNKAIELIGPGSKITAVDISSTSMAITKSIITYFKPDNTNVNYHTIDMLKLNLDEKYDFITMGEVLEHVNFPETLLLKLRDLMNKNARTFVSTCVNCPAIDHVYHFKTVDEIREMFYKCGLIIEEERVAAVEDLPFEEIMKRKITINYCAILKRSDEQI
jgi:2-polyprenyl-3-methyl-5-hydroxy-6-metoxy-1,4-benzoquinol methylase